jgi:hypothetical protein
VRRESLSAYRSTLSAAAGADCVTVKVVVLAPLKHRWDSRVFDAPALLT